MSKKLNKAEILAADPSTLIKSDFEKLKNWIDKGEKSTFITKSDDVIENEAIKLDDIKLDDDIDKDDNKKEEASNEDEKFYEVDIALKNDDETMEEFLLRATDEELGKWVTVKDPKGNAGLESEEEAKADDSNNTIDPNAVLVSVRKEIDQLKQYAESHFGKKHDVIESLFLGKGWLGKSLEALGVNNPYTVKGGVKTAKDIPATADVAEVTAVMLREFDNLNELDKILKLRKDLAKLIIEVAEFDKIPSIPGFARFTAAQSFINLTEARFHLGNELAKIRNAH